MAASATALSRWCAAGTIEVEVCEDPGSGVWETRQSSGHGWCQSERWHDEYHGKDPGCCAGPEERESWACECPCHEQAKPYPWAKPDAVEA